MKYIQLTTDRGFDALASAGLKSKYANRVLREIVLNADLDTQSYLNTVTMIAKRCQIDNKTARSVIAILENCQFFTVKECKNTHSRKYLLNAELVACCFNHDTGEINYGADSNKMQPERAKRERRERKRLDFQSPATTPDNPTPPHERDYYDLLKEVHKEEGTFLH